MKTRNDKLYLYDIAECCRKILEYSEGISNEEFQTNVMLQDAIVRNIEIVGEASKNLTSETRENNPQIAWRDIMRMRDKIVHHYFRLKLDVIWDTIKQDIPTLKPEIENILETFSDK